MATGPSTTTTPYVNPLEPNVRITSILTVGDQVGFKSDGTTPYRMVGIPDGLGAYDNGDGTITVLMNHEIGQTLGVVREHGAIGAFVSQYVIDKTTLQVISGKDAFDNVQLWDRATETFFEPAVAYAIGRLCSADLPPISAYYWVDDLGTADTSDDVAYGTQDRIFMTGEEIGPEGKEFGVVVSGAEAGTAYELAHLGLFSWENAISSPYAQKKTINIGMDDGLNGQVYVYIGDKKTSGDTAVDLAGLNDGKLYGIKALNLNNATDNNNESSAIAANGRFELVDEGDVSNLTGAALDAKSESLGVTTFLRPEDGQFDTLNPNVFWFVTTNAFNSPSRLYKLTFDDITNPEAGGTIVAALDGTEGQQMLDNMTVSPDGLIYLQEDVGNNAHIGRILVYDQFADTLTPLAEHDRDRFLNGAPQFKTQDEESSGIIDVTSLLGDSDTKAFLFDVQSHNALADPELVQDGQLAVMYIDEVMDGGDGNDRVAGDQNANTLNGNRGDDTVLGGSANDVLYGGRGVDVLDGGRDSDVMAGGLDADSFVFETLTAGATDYITDFSVKSGDTFVLGAGVTVGGVQIGYNLGGDSFGGLDLQNGDRSLDLAISLVSAAGTQTVYVLDAYAFSTDAFWEGALGLSLATPSLPGAAAFAIA